MRLLSPGYVPRAQSFSERPTSRNCSRVTKRTTISLAAATTLGIWIVHLAARAAEKRLRLQHVARPDELAATAVGQFVFRRTSAGSWVSSRPTGGSAGAACFRRGIRQPV